MGLGALTGSGGSFSVPVGPIVAVALIVIGIVIAVGVIGSVRADRRRKRRAERRRREALVDADLELLEPTGDELPRYVDFDEPAPSAPFTAASTSFSVGPMAPKSTVT